MNLPWDKSYFKLCFYIIFTFMVIYIFKNAIDIIIYGLMNMGGIYRSILYGTSSVISVFSVIIIGFVIAYVLNPLVEFFVNMNLKRGLSVMIVLLILLVLIAIIIFAVILNITDFGKYTMTGGINLQIELFNKNIAKLQAIIRKYDIGNVIKFKEFIFNKELIYSVFSNVAQIFLGLIISIYFLIDKDKIILSIKEYYSLIPSKITRVITYILKRLDRAFSGYIRGQLSDAVIMSALISFVLSLIKVPFSIPIGVISGFLNIVPYFGAISGFVMAVGVTALSGNYVGALYAAAAIFVLQQIDSIYIVPKVVGQSVKLSPVSVIIALAVAANMFGLWGMVFAVPVVSFIKIILRDYIDNKKRNDMQH